MNVVDGSEALPTSDVLEGRAALGRIANAIDEYLYTNEHLQDGSRRSVFSGPNREKLMGGHPPPDADIAKEWERLIHPEDWSEHLAHRERLKRGEPSDVVYRLRGYDGVTRWIHARTRSHRVGGRLFVDGIVSDITERREAEAALLRTRQELERQLAVNAHQALHDPLTDLGNRRKLFQDLAMVPSVTTAADPGLLVMCDLDGFKNYNDSFGHPAGDELLIRIARRLTTAVGDQGLVFRLGGDEFCVLAVGGVDSGLLVDRVEAAMVEKGEGFAISGAWGVAFIPSEARDPEAALSLADNVCTRTSKVGGGLRQGRSPTFCLPSSRNVTPTSDCTCKTWPRTPA